MTANIVLLISTSLVWIGTIVFFFIKKKQALQRVSFASIGLNGDLTATLNQAVNVTPIDRALILVAQNGNTLKYGSVVYEINNGSVGQVKNKFQAMELDASYSLMINELEDKKRLVLR